MCAHGRGAASKRKLFIKKFKRAVLMSTTNFKTKFSPSLLQSSLPLVLIGAIWAAYLIAYSVVHQNNWGWVIPSATNNGMLFVLAFSFFSLWRKAETGSMAKILFGVFVISRFFVFGSIAIYYGIRYLLHLPHLTTFWSALNDIFFIVDLILVSLSFLLILLSAKVDAKKSITIYIPVVFVAIIFFSISFYVVKWNPADVPVTMATWSTSIYAIVEKTLDMLCIVVAALCVALARNKGIFYLALGFLIGIATEVVLAFGMFSQEYGVGSAFEGGYFLGDLLAFYGLILLSKSKHLSNVRAWTAAPDSARGQSAYWCIVLSLITAALTIATVKVVNPKAFNAEWLPSLPVILVACVVFAAILSNSAAKKLTQPFQRIKSLIDDFLHTDKAPDLAMLETQNLYLAEFKQLQGFLVQAFSDIQEKRKMDRECFAVAAQVAHDISSPLASLLMVTQSCADIPENTRITMREAIAGINDIAQNLLRRFESKCIQENSLSSEESTENEIEKKQPVLISLVLAQLITDKRYQYRDLPVSFESYFSGDSNFAFIKAVSSDFKRMLSNLLNNAVDALDGNLGQVTLRLEVNNKIVKIIVHDTGKGMSQDVIDKIKHNISVTKSKNNGHGIGFIQIAKALKNNHGEITIASKVGHGTQITLIFPRIAPCAWLATELELGLGDIVVVLDDDSSIHGAWEERFKKYTNEISIKHFQVGFEALNFINKLGAAKNKVFLLSDYELLNQDLTGIDIIESAELPKGRALLVTSHYSNQTVLDYAAKTEIKVLPKQLACEIPIKLKANTDSCSSKITVRGAALGDFKKPAIIDNKKVDMVLVDDDETFSQALAYLVNQQSGKIVDTYNRPQDFLKNLQNYSQDTKICLDNNLSSSITGLELADRLHEQGYKHLYLLSGCDFFGGEIPNFITPIIKTDFEKIKQLIL